MKELSLALLDSVSGGVDIELNNGVTINNLDVGFVCAKFIEYSLNLVIQGYISRDEAQSGINRLPCSAVEMAYLQQRGLFITT